MAPLAVALPYITAAAAAAGTALSVMGQIQAGKAQKGMAEYNAAVDRNNAIAARQSAKYDADRMRDNTRKLLAMQRAKYGMSGGGFSGTPLLVMEQTAKEAEMDAQAVEYGGELKATGYESQATMSEYEGRVAKRASYSKAFSTLLTGAGAVLGRSGLLNSGTTTKTPYIPAA
jgi:hypothetical protein